jgi:hypothetical protein
MAHGQMLRSWATETMISNIKTILQTGLISCGLLFFSTLTAESATINIGAVAASTNTGYYLNSDGSYLTNGEILVGTFSISIAQIEAMIEGWSNSSPSFEHYTNLYSDFTEVGTGGSSGSVVPGWSFNSNGVVAGTSTGVDTTIVSPASQLYVWTFNTTNFSSSGFNQNTEWSLVTATNWIAPGALGTVSLNLAQVSSNDILIGQSTANPLLPHSVNLVAASVPEPSSQLLLMIASAVALLLLRFKRVSKKQEVFLPSVSDFRE